MIRVLGVDPGLTRCGVGIVDVAENRSPRWSRSRDPNACRIRYWKSGCCTIGRGIEELLQRHKPQAVALERVFAQANLRTVMGTAQASGVTLYLAAKHGLAVGLHTPTEVKASITGYGGAGKQQVANMVQRILRLDAPPNPADASDALALAICHAWRRRAAVRGPAGRDHSRTGSVARRRTVGLEVGGSP